MCVVFDGSLKRAGDGTRIKVTGFGQSRQEPGEDTPDGEVGPLVPLKQAQRILNSFHSERISLKALSFKDKNEGGLEGG